MGNKLVGYGSYLPSRIVTNVDLERVMDTTDAWIVERTGIRARHFADENETVVDMATNAARAALKKANLSIDDIDMIIVATTTPEIDFPMSVKTE